MAQQYNGAPNRHVEAAPSQPWQQHRAAEGHHSRYRLHSALLSQRICTISSTLLRWQDNTAKPVAGVEQNPHIKLMVIVTETHSALAPDSTRQRNIQMSPMRMLISKTILMSGKCMTWDLTSDLTTALLAALWCTVCSIIIPCRNDAQDEDFVAGGNAHQGYSKSAAA